MLPFVLLATLIVAMVLCPCQEERHVIQMEPVKDAIPLVALLQVMDTLQLSSEANRVHLHDSKASRPKCMR